jgi:hypothetical protein
VISCPPATKIPFIITLTQTDQIRKRAEAVDGSYESCNEPIAFHLFQLRHFDHHSFLQRESPTVLHYTFNDNLVDKVASTGVYVYERDVNKLCLLGTGGYLIVPSTFDSRVSLRFLFRVCVEAKYTCMRGHRIDLYDLNDSGGGGGHDLKSSMSSNEDLLNSSSSDRLSSRSSTSTSLVQSEPLGGGIFKSSPLVVKKKPRSRSTSICAII